MVSDPETGHDRQGLVFGRMVDLLRAHDVPDLKVDDFAPRVDVDTPAENQAEVRGIGCIQRFIGVEFVLDATELFGLNLG